MRIDSTFKPKFDNANVIKKSVGVTIPGAVGSKPVASMKGRPKSSQGRVDYFSYEVAGFYYHKDWARNATVLEDAYPKEAVVVLDKEINNAYDPNATLVKYSDETKSMLGIPDSNEILGYVPQKFTKKIADYSNSGHGFYSTVTGYSAPTQGNTYPTITVTTEVYKD